MPEPVVALLTGLDLGDSPKTKAYEPDRDEVRRELYDVLAEAKGARLTDVDGYGVDDFCLGDTGSMFFGLMLGTLTVYSGGKVATAFLVLGIPLLDVGFVILRRVWHRRSPLRGSMTGEHLHHRLLAKGWSARQVIVLTAGIGLLFGSTALFLSSLQKFIAGVLLLLLMLALSIYSKTRN